jgi:hypothetical protein
VPVAGTLAWRRYGADWVGLDAPRHQFVPTVRSMHLLADRAGLRVERVFFDSHALQFWGSERYRADLPLHAGGAAPARGRALRDQHNAARRLNRLGDGDSAGFVLRRR